MEYAFDDFSFLSHEKLKDNLYRVVEDFGGPQKICIYVVTGETQTAVIDSGFGVTHGLRRYIETYITDKAPMINYMTHSHPDHIGGCTLFDRRFIHADELPQLPWNLNDGRRLFDAYSFAFSGLPGSKAHGDLERARAVYEYCKQNYIPVNWREVRFEPIEDGDVLDLGGIELTCIYMNAHGSMVYYNREQDYALCGDNFTYTLALGRIDDILVERYERFIPKFTDKTVFYSGHLYYEDMVTRPQEIDMPLLKEAVEIMRRIAAGDYPPEDQPNVKYSYPGAPVMQDYKPDTDDPDLLASIAAQHPERSGRPQKQGVQYLHRCGPILVTYVK